MANVLSLIDGQCVYNPQMDYIRVPCHGSFKFLNRYPTKDMLFDFFDQFLKLTKNGTKIVFDNSSEAEDIELVLFEEGNPLVLDWMLDYIKERNLNDNQIELWTSDFNCENNISLKYKQLPKCVLQLHNFPPLTHDINRLESRIHDKKFLCAMSRVTPNRKNFYNWIVEAKLEDEFYYSYNARDTNVNMWDIGEPKIPLERYNNEIFSDDGRGEFANYKFQLKSIINIVSETIYENINTKFITEKTFRAISMAQPFILLAQPHILNKLKSYGFKTFSDFWDESYDGIEDDGIRFDIIKKIILELNNKSIADLSVMYHKMIPILIHNYNNLFKLNKYYEFHTTYTFNKVDRYEHNALDYINNII